ncbi:MAG: gliding motility-associated C-terminal domain-containing protein [Bacteroidetes bacterium]|nr:gliding motility-associated C-terminal domain-containing protein [Bacteroidota bacterium]MCL1969467.1 gliding motility-associated C-terminal domain-containing protein [Bacteroidota bacterium]
MLINGEEKPAASYCPGDSILFDFAVLDSTIKNYTYYWWDNFHIGIEIHNTTPIKIAFPIVSDDYKVSIKFTIPTDSVDFIETLTTDIKIDFIRTILDTTVCQGRNISVPTNTHGILTYTDVQATVETPWDTLHSVSGCDSLVRWHISMDPYITLKYKISSCDSVIWGDIVVKRPPNVEGDWETQIERMFYATDPDVSCDTLITLDVTIIDTGVLKIIFDQDVYCSNDDPQGTIELETNFTAFGWTYLDKDSMWTETEKSTDIEYAGYYRVHAYMDTSLYDTLQNLRIVNCFLEKNTLVEDCPLIIPNVITPNGDNQNEMLGIKKLNPVRENELTIYDRWGKVVFHQKNYKCIFKGSAYLNQEDAFKGISQGGQKLPEGTYYYAFKYASIPKTKKYTGTIVILR